MPSEHLEEEEKGIPFGLLEEEEEKGPRAATELLLYFPRNSVL